MTRTYGLSTDVRALTEDLTDQVSAYTEAVDDATEDRTITRLEIYRILRYRRVLTGTVEQLLPKVEQLDDAHRIALPVLTLGMDDAGRRNPGRVRDYERLHGPIRIDRYRRRRPINLAKVRNAKRRRSEATPNDAA